MSGWASSAAQVARRPSSGLQPRFQTGPKSCITSVVRPPASAASQICGESQCTWQSMPPGVATRPRPSITAVAVSSTTSIASIVSGLPARPTATTRPSVTPMLVRRTPSTGIEQQDVGDRERDAAALGAHREAVAHRAAHARGDAGRVVALGLDHEAGVAERDAAAQAPR